MRLALPTVLCASLVVGAVPVRASPAPAPEPSVIPEDDHQAVDVAEAAWSRGGWMEVRQVLEPVAEDPDRLQDPRVREKALCLLADATVNDPELDEEERREQAAGYLERLLDADPTWRLPTAIYSPDLFELFVEVQDRRSRQASAQCEADRNACQADLAYARADIEDLERRYAELDSKFQDQEIEVRARVARSRAFAAIPGGIGHFYNGEPGIGAAFLATEAVIGLSGLTLILYRTIADGCRREQGFQRGSLTCAADRNLDAILRRRKAEEALGWLFIGSMALDIVVAQLRFRPFKTETVERVPRRELDGDDAPNDGRRRRRARPEGKPRAKVRPTGGGIRRGVGLGISVRF